MDYEASEAEHGKPDTLKKGKELMCVSPKEPSLAAADVR
jgi:hypothetical protein